MCLSATPRISHSCRPRCTHLFTLKYEILYEYNECDITYWNSFLCILGLFTVMRKRFVVLKLPSSTAHTVNTIAKLDLYTEKPVAIKQMCCELRGA